MKNVFKIFISDLKAIATHFFAAVIILAVLVIPALYAWVNIYANWDPYGNTGNVPIALANSDRGYVIEHGEYVNKGQEIMKELAESTSIKWVIEESEEAAVQGVKEGKYYGALVMKESLTRNMYELITALEDEAPSIVFYQNAKTNAIANKITTTAATTAEHKIQVKYLSVLIAGMLEEVDDLMKDVDEEEALEDLIKTLTRLRDHLYGYAEMIQKLRGREGDILSGLDSAASHVGGLDMGPGIDRTQDAAATVSAIESEVLDRIQTIDNRITALENAIKGLDPGSLTPEIAAGFLDQVQGIETALEALQSILPNTGLISSAVNAAINTMLQRAQSLEKVIQAFQGTTPTLDIKKDFLSSMITALDDLHKLLQNNLIPSVRQLFENIVRDLQILTNILSSVNTVIADVQPVISSAKSTIVAVDGTLGQLQRLLSSGGDAMDKLLQKAIEARDSDLVEDLIALLNGDPEQFAEFFSQPVTVVTETVYPVENYGSGMAPFYSVLAVWVGCVISGAVIKPEPETDKLRNVRENQKFWGRFLIFFLIGQIQAAIIVAGDIYLLGCQCLHPGLLFMTGAITSLVFNMVMYALTVTFGDIGKAIGVVIMIVQIAGSSGSYPIEILPPIFSKIYLFFPFPYAINAMRETMFGMYRLDLLKYLGELMIFGVLGVLLGLKVKRHFIGINEFVEEEMERTGVL